MSDFVGNHKEQQQFLPLTMKYGVSASQQQQKGQSKLCVIILVRSFWWIYLVLWIFCSQFFFYMNSSIKNQARTWARYRGKCPKCADAIELNDPIVDVYINDQGKTWDCKTM